MKTTKKNHKIYSGISLSFNGSERDEDFSSFVSHINRFQYTHAHATRDTKTVNIKWAE